MKPLNIIVLVAVVLVGAAAWFYWYSNKNNEQTNNQIPDTKPDKKPVGNPQIREMQVKLNAALPAFYTKLVEDGIWGAKTQAAIVYLIQNKTLPSDLQKQIQDMAKDDISNEYNTMSEKLYNAMNGPGTNFTAIIEVIRQLKDITQWQNLVNAFGTKKSTYSSFSGGLYAWLKSELDWAQNASIERELAKIGATLKI